MGSTIFRTLGHQEIFSSKHGLIFGQINATRDGENKIKAKSIVMEAANDELPNVGKALADRPANTKVETIYFSSRSRR